MILAARTNAIVVVTIFVDQCISIFGIPSTIVASYGQQNTSEFFRAMGLKLCCAPLTITVYYPQMNRLVERYNETVVSRLSHFVTERQQELDSYKTLLTFPHNFQTLWSAKMIPLSLVLNRQPPGPTSPTTDKSQKGHIKHGRNKPTEWRNEKIWNQIKRRRGIVINKRKRHREPLHEGKQNQA